MKNKITIYFVGLIAFSLLSCDDDCMINPDLSSDLLVPTVDLILGEPVDWNYVVESVEDNNENDCEIVSAAASIGQILIEFFDDDGRQSTTVFMAQNEVGVLNSGDLQTINNTVDVFNEEGIYTITVTADQTNAVNERNETNNSDILEADASETRIQAEFIKENFRLIHNDFLDKATKVSAIVVIGDQFSKKNRLNNYKGVPIYYGRTKQ